MSMLRTFAEDSATRSVAANYVQAIEVRGRALPREGAAVPAAAEAGPGSADSGAPEVERDPALAAFLAHPDLRGIPALSIR